MWNQPQPIRPGPGQESVWDYPRPPRLETVEERLSVIFNGETIAETYKGLRVLETSHPPVYYFPPHDVISEFLISEGGNTICEFKGRAKYWSLSVNGFLSRSAAWSYPEPSSAFLSLQNFIAFYASRVDSCWVGGEQVNAQTGDFYGGWITSKIVGPFKGAVGTRHW